MDKYIKMLIIKLSEKYHVTVTTIMFSGNEAGRVSNVIKFKLMDKEREKIIYTKDCNGKRELVSEMVKWAEPTIRPKS